MKNPSSKISLERAADFIWRNARLLERVMFAHAFLNGPAEAVTNSVLAYRNADSGFGNAMEPEVRAPESMPLHCEIALRALSDSGIRDARIAKGVCDFLASTADSDGRVPIVTAKIRDYPRAAHWSDPQSGGDSPNPTAALTGLLHYQGVEHPWLSRATEWCWRRFEKPIEEAHEILNALTFLEYLPTARVRRRWPCESRVRPMGPSGFSRMRDPQATASRHCSCVRAPMPSGVPRFPMK